MNKFHILCAALLAGASLVANAQDADAPQRGQRMAELQKRFAAADTNGDGRLTKEEARKMPMVAKHFDEIDTGHNGSVSMADITAYLRARRRAQKEAP